MPKKTLKYEHFLELGEKMKVIRDILVELSIEIQNNTYNKYSINKAIDIIDDKRSGLENLMYLRFPKDHCKTSIFYGPRLQTGETIEFEEYIIEKKRNRE